MSTASISAAEAARFWIRVDKNGPRQPHMATPCWIWTGAKQTRGLPYGKASLKRRTIVAQRLAFMIVNGPIPPGVKVLHRCDFPACVRAETGGEGHLFLGDALSNARDRDAKGRTAVGERHGRHTKPDRNARGARNGRAKLTPEQVVELCAVRRETGLAYDKLGARFGIGEAQARRIVKGVRWNSPALAEAIRA